MSDLKPGDVCEVVAIQGTKLPEWTGRTVVITRVFPLRGRTCHATRPMPKSPHPGWRFRGWWRESLRKLDPPDWTKIATDLPHKAVPKHTKRPLLTLPK